MTFAFGAQTPTTTLSSTDEQRLPDAANWEESLICIEAIVNAFMFLYGQLVIEVDVRTSPKSGERGVAELNSLVRNIEIRRGAFGLAIPAKIPAKRTAAVGFCLNFQCVATIVPKNPESNQWLKLLLLL